MLGGQIERREQITCSGNEDATVDGKSRKDHVRHQGTQEDDKVCQMSTFVT